jgi:hypothetical protein
MAGWWAGVLVGERKERRRCAGFCERSFSEGMLSATARRIYFSIINGRQDLVSEDEFFGADKSANREKVA